MNRIDRSCYDRSWATAATTAAVAAAAVRYVDVDDDSGAIVAAMASLSIFPMYRGVMTATPRVGLAWTGPTT